MVWRHVIRQLFVDGRLQATALEFTRSFNPSAMPLDNALLRLPFYEGTGTTPADTSGNGHHGTLHDADWIPVFESESSVPPANVN